MTRPNNIITKLIVILFFLSLKINSYCTQLNLLETKTIWKSDYHNAFTDLIWHKDKWYCVFRIGNKHGGDKDYGIIKVLTSKDGDIWEESNQINVKNLDLRDPKLSIDPLGGLLINSTLYNHAESNVNIRKNISVVFEHNENDEWSGPYYVGDEDYWLWKTTWYKNTGYSVGYRWGNMDATKLYTTKSGKEYKVLVNNIRPPNDKSNEHDMFFNNDGNAYLVVRRDNSNSKEKSYALLGKAKEPYLNWNWKSLEIVIGSPEVVKFTDDIIIMCVRRMPNKEYRKNLILLSITTMVLTILQYYIIQNKNFSLLSVALKYILILLLFIFPYLIFKSYINSGSDWVEIGYLNTISDEYQSMLRLPSSGDCGYSGLYLKDNILWVSYYSSHEGSANIYLSKVEIKL